MTASANPRETCSDHDLASAIRVLAMDAVEKAKSGHPGMPMGMADVATVLFTRFLKFDAANPDWLDRDRFVLSAGHGSMLVYALHYLLGFPGIERADLEAFRQLGAKTAGHPEYGHAPGIETTTGPLGQGLGNAVGMAIAEAHLAARYGAGLVDHRTVVIAGDGCLMEGISQEAISLAGHLRLRKLTVLWDDNGISIDGPVSLADSTDQLARFEACGWACERIDGHDHAAIKAALERADTDERPSLIACRTTIGFGAPTKAGKAASHGAPLGAEEIAGVREALGWPHAPFEIPEPILTAWRAAGQRGHMAREGWEGRLGDDVHGTAFAAALRGPDLAKANQAVVSLKKAAIAEPGKVATRKASEMVLNALNPVVDTMLGGSADLTGSNNTRSKDLEILDAENPAGRYLHYGIREHAMAAAMNGMALHGGVIPYGGTFLVFTDYCRPAIRLSALMEQRVIYVMTHDSIGLGEDGPTHQPVEHLAALRAIPNLDVYRPADLVETAECWALALASEKTPSILALTRQGLEPARLEHTDENLSAQGAYVIADAPDSHATIFATGSEVEIAIAAQQKLACDTIRVRVVSVPCLDRFERQSAALQAEILGDRPRLVIEAGIRQGWDRIIGETGRFIGMESFGASAPGPQLYEHFGITTEAAVAAVKDMVA